MKFNTVANGKMKTCIYLGNGYRLVVVERKGVKFGTQGY